MAFWFGDSFDLYTVLSDAATYWDAALGGSVSLALSSSGRFAGSRGIATGATGSGTPYITKTSSVNDAVHHISVAFQQTSALSGTTAGAFITFYDGATAQCSIVFQNGGNIILTSGAYNGTTLASYTGAVAAINTWYQFEIEVVVNNTTGSFAVRKLGNTSNDFFLGSLNTRTSANNYANKMGIGVGNITIVHLIDDFLWRSDASSLAWLGDIRCYTRMPASDASVAWTRSGTTLPFTPFVQQGTLVLTANQGIYHPVVAPITGTLASVNMTFTVTGAVNLKCTLYASSGTAPTTPIASATPLASPGVGVATFVFPSPPSITQGTPYYIATNADAGVGTVQICSGSTAASFKNSDTYASFPTTNPTVSGGGNPKFITANIIPAAPTNAAWVAEPQQDQAGTYVFSSTVGQSDLYNIGSLSATPGSIVGVTTRAYMQKSDAGTRIAAVQLQSGAANVQGSLTLNTTWVWAYRNDLVDPNTGAAWTATAVNNVDLGVVVTT